MSKLLLIMGDLAAGKSTFANILSKRYGVSMFGKDTIKEVLGDTIGFANREENLKLSGATIELMMFLFKEFAKLNKPLILESNFHTKELERLQEMAKENDYEVLTIVLRGNVEVLHRRYLHRMYNENRHPVHLSTTLDVYENFNGYLEHSRKEEIPGERLEINADDFSYQTDGMLLGKIDAFMARCNERRPMLVLRDMRESDIEDYVRWFTTETEWGDWDSPWEGHFEGSEEEERHGWTEYYESVKNLPDEVVRWKYEIEADGTHIGWICAYTDLGYLDNPEEIWALGLDIPCMEGRKCGNGTKALQMYMDYLKEHGQKSFYTQTWSGNSPMIRVAEKLGFKEVCRKKNYREVRGNLYDAITWRLDLE